MSWQWGYLRCTGEGRSTKSTCLASCLAALPCCQFMLPSLHSPAGQSLSGGNPVKYWSSCMVRLDEGTKWREWLLRSKDIHDHLFKYLPNVCAIVSLLYGSTINTRGFAYIFFRVGLGFLFTIEFSP